MADAGAPTGSLPRPDRPGHRGAGGIGARGRRACCTRRAPGSTSPTSTPDAGGSLAASSGTAPASASSTSPTRPAGPPPWTLRRTGPLTTLVNCAGAALQAAAARHLARRLPPHRRPQPDRHLPRPPRWPAAIGGRRLDREHLLAQRRAAHRRARRLRRLEGRRLGAHPGRRARVRRAGHHASTRSARAASTPTSPTARTSPTSTGTPTSGRSPWAGAAAPTRSPRRCSTSPRTRARYVTGTNLVIDGGIAAGRRTP